MSSATNPKSNLTADETKIYDIIASHQGASAAITCEVIAGRIGMNIRQVRDTIKTLIENHYLPIVATSRAPYGYFIPKTVNEVVIYKKVLNARARSIQQRMKALDVCMQQTFLQQPTLF
jgi:ERCC4-related helicase